VIFFEVDKNEPSLYHKLQSLVLCVTTQHNKSHNEFHDIYSSLNIGVVKSRVRGIGHVVHMGEKRNANGILVRESEGQKERKVLC